MRKINKIIVHCSYTFPEMDIGAAEIRAWHVNDNKWRDIGYHFVIRRNGVIEDGRPLREAGAHVAGQNADSIGVCLVGGRGRSGRQDTNFTHAQWVALYRLVAKLENEFPGAEVAGHNDFTNGKTCPTFDVKAWWRNA
jgi:N-acetylmuramoyl-L-alanine amidase